jgi:hypothetical protein
VLAGALLALALIMLENFEQADDSSPEPGAYADYRAPVANPPPDPNRPDLWEESRIDE